MATQLPPSARSADRPLNLIEQATRNAATVKADYRQRENLCAVNVKVGVFFDGTNNNKRRDQEDVLKAGGAPSACSHSNVVVLHDAFPDDQKNGLFRIYVPGVGTPFADVKELTETPDGKAKATGGDARINWALIQVLNAMHYSIHTERLIQNSTASDDSTSRPLHYSLAPDANCAGKRQYFSEKLAKLKTKLASRPPKKLTSVTLYVFGFSRGSAQARAFCHFLEHSLLQKEGGSYTLAGVPFRLQQFLGLFDSVASVGLADSSPFWRGLGGWANGTLDGVPCVERTVHLVAAHEIRINFPLSTARIGKHQFPRNTVEKVYPGSHSDVGGGYARGSQGKCLNKQAQRKRFAVCRKKKSLCAGDIEA
ncbi:DUF2235 domain-containing protein [Variovorax humicola]|uniref:DUF2235 domain-containing protein n=1 Tax=Variovorax humicola TaxID=1769758 RepID=A0ABU8WBA3_9BURK